MCRRFPRNNIKKSSPIISEEGEGREGRGREGKGGEGRGGGGRGREGRGGEGKGKGRAKGKEKSGSLCCHTGTIIIFLVLFLFIKPCY